MKVTQPRSGVPIGTANVAGRVLEVATHPEFQRFFESLVARIGGVAGPSNADLQAELDALEVTVAALVVGHAIQDEGITLTQRPILNFTGSAVTVTDTGATTEVAITGGSGSGLTHPQVLARGLGA